MVQGYKEELKDNKGIYLRFEITDEYEWVYMDWIGQQDETRIKDGMDRAIQLLKKFNIHKILNNNSNHHGPYPEMIYDWIENYWIPRAQKNGLLVTATILSPKVFSRLSAQMMEQKFKHLNYRNFEDEEEAKKWLRQAKK